MIDFNTADTNRSKGKDFLAHFLGKDFLVHSLWEDLGRIDDEKMSAFHQNSGGIVFVLWLTLLNTSSGFEDEFKQKCIAMDISLYKWFCGKFYQLL